MMMLSGKDSNEATKIISDNLKAGREKLVKAMVKLITSPKKPNGFPEVDRVGSNKNLYSRDGKGFKAFLDTTEFKK